MNERPSSSLEDCSVQTDLLPVWKRRCNVRRCYAMPVRTLTLRTLVVVLLPVLLASGSLPPMMDGQSLEEGRDGTSRETAVQDRRRAQSLGAAGAEGRIRGFVKATGRWLRPAGRAVPVRERALWVARCIYAETNRPPEQQLVAWVVRNRVETRFRGQSTYKGAVLDPGQFTPFNGPDRPGGRWRDYYLWLHPAAEAPGWKDALRIAVSVIGAPSAWRPFSLETRHFFSEVSMPSGHWPRWAEGQPPVRVRRGVQPDPRRFRFFEGVPARAPAQPHWRRSR